MEVGHGLANTKVLPYIPKIILNQLRYIVLNADLANIESHIQLSLLGDIPGNLHASRLIFLEQFQQLYHSGPCVYNVLYSQTIHSEEKLVSTCGQEQSYLNHQHTLLGTRFPCSKQL